MDAGVDTGGVLYQKVIPLAGNETILTDAIVQVAHSMEITLNAIDDASKGKILLKVVKDVNIPSKLWFQPTIWSYIWCGITKNIW